MLPAHNLLLKGKGYEAVFLSGIGSYGAVLFCFLLLFPIRFIIGEPLFFYDTLRDIMFFVLLSISILMIGTEKGKININLKNKYLPYFLGMGFAFFVFIISGLFGIFIFEITVESPIGLSSPVLFPALAGLFGTPTLLKSLLTKPTIPKQNIVEPVFDKNKKRSSLLSVITGSLGGILVSIIPGITSATGTILAMNARGESDKRQTIVTLSAVNTACAFFVVAVLFIIMRSRSGATLAIKDLISIEEWNAVILPSNLGFLLMSVLLAGTLSFFSLLKIGRLFAEKFSKLPYSFLIKITLFFVLLLVFLFTGVIGLFVLFIATSIGLIPVEWGIRRSHCMGVLLIPILLYFV